nr:MAG TPA: conotoxin [Caudoviricetes sp.]
MALVLSHYRCPPLCLMGISSITAFQRSVTV